VSWYTLRQDRRPEVPSESESDWTLQLAENPIEPPGLTDRHPSASSSSRRHSHGPCGLAGAAAPWVSRSPRKLHGTLVRLASLVLSPWRPLVHFRFRLSPMWEVTQVSPMWRLHKLRSDGPPRPYFFVEPHRPDVRDPVSKHAPGGLATCRRHILELSDPATGIGIEYTWPSGLACCRGGEGDVPCCAPRAQRTLELPAVVLHGPSVDYRGGAPGDSG